MRPPRRFVAVLSLVATSGCFALFSLDGYEGPNGEVPDDANVPPRDGQQTDRESGAPLPAHRIVFVTSTVQDGTLGGILGADPLCTKLATDAKLPGAYRAWLSDRTSSPSSRFPALIALYDALDASFAE